MESCPITSWPVVGESVEAVRNFIFLGSKITTYGDCSHEIKKKKMLAPWNESYNKPWQHITKQRYDFADKGLYSQIYV